MSKLSASLSDAYRVQGRPVGGLGEKAIVLSLNCAPCAGAAYFIAHASSSFWPAINKGDQAVVLCFGFLWPSTGAGIGASTVSCGGATTKENTAEGSGAGGPDKNRRVHSVQSKAARTRLVMSFSAGCKHRGSLGVCHRLRILQGAEKLWWVWWVGLGGEIKEERRWRCPGASSRSSDAEIAGNPQAPEGLRRRGAICSVGPPGRYNKHRRRRVALHLAPRRRNQIRQSS